MLPPRGFWDRFLVNTVADTGRTANSGVKAIFAPTWTKAAVSLVAGFFLGLGGLFVYLSSVCFHDHDCAAYSPWKVFVSYVLSWPIFVLQKIFFGTVDKVPNFGPVVIGKYGWLAVWVYYYLIVSLASHAMKFAPRKSRR